MILEFWSFEVLGFGVYFGGVIIADKADNGNEEPGSFEDHEW